jgi:hypothetical protein
VSEIDLIPAGYRERLGLKRWIDGFGITLIALVILIGVVRVGLGYGIRAQERELETLRSAKAEALRQKAHLDQLSRQAQELQRRLTILGGLRGGVSAREMFPTVDRALSEGVWFTSWEFRRAGELVEKDPETVNTGYFIVVPKQAADEPERAWRMQTHMEIHAHALDHSTLAGFVRRLVEQPEIEEARVLNTSTRHHGSPQIVDFDLVLVVNSRT